MAPVRPRSVGAARNYALNFRLIQLATDSEQPYFNVAGGKRAGRKQIPALVREKDDEAAFIQLVLANAQGTRSGPHPARDPLCPGAERSMESTLGGFMSARGRAPAAQRHVWRGWRGGEARLPLRERAGRCGSGTARPVRAGGSP